MRARGRRSGQHTIDTAIEQTSSDQPTATILSDLGRRDRFVQEHGGDLRFVAGLGWLAWTGTRWQLHAKHVAMERACATVRRIATEILKRSATPDRAQVLKHALKAEDRPRIEAIVALAESHPDVRLDVSRLDADPWLFNVQNGTLDLRTGDLGEHRREGYLTKIAPVAYDPEARSPLWERFLADVQPDPEVRAFLARYAGYCLTGTMGEQVFAIHHGGGENGKGVYSDTLIAVLGLGEYAKVTPYDTFLVRRQGSATNDLAALRGARLVVAAEPNEGVRLDEAAVKGFTGEDPITCRFHYEECRSSRPKRAAPSLSGNHRPRIRGTDHAMWRRVRLVPSAVAVAPDKRDNDLRRKLKDELPGVLAWAVRGCLDWQREGLRPPPSCSRRRVPGVRGPCRPLHRGSLPAWVGPGRRVEGSAGRLQGLVRGGGRGAPLGQGVRGQAHGPGDPGREGRRRSPGPGVAGGRPRARGRGLRRMRRIGG